MLLAGLQRHTQRLLAGSIHRYADDAAGSGSFVFIFKCEISSVRAAEAHRDAEALGAAQGNVGTQLGGCFQQHQAHDIGSHGHHCAFGFHSGNHIAQVGHVAVFAHILEQRAEVFAVASGIEIAHHQLKIEIFGPGFDHVQRLRVNALVHKELVRFGFAHAARHGHGFGGGGGFVEQGGAGQLEAGEVDTHLLEVQQRFQTALRHFGLIGRVGGVPAWIFQHIAQNHIRQAGGVVA